MTTILRKSLYNLELEVELEKCASFKIVDKDKTWASIDILLSYKGAKLLLTGLEETMCYSGLSINPWNKWSKRDVGK
jgi:hypothetical protein